MSIREITEVLDDIMTVAWIIFIKSFAVMRVVPGAGQDA